MEPGKLAPELVQALIWRAQATKCGHHGSVSVARMIVKIVVEAQENSPQVIRKQY